MRSDAVLVEMASENVTLPAPALSDGRPACDERVGGTQTGHGTRRSTRDARTGPVTATTLLMPATELLPRADDGHSMNLRVMSVDGAYNWFMISVGLLILVAAIAVVAFWMNLVTF